MEGEAPKANEGRKLFFGLFIFPLLIMVGMALLLSVIVIFTHESENPESLITQIKTGPPSKRWQKAFELSNELNRKSGMLRDEGVMREMIHILKDDLHYDPKTRSYMAIALSHFPSPQAREALRVALEDPSEDVQLYVLWALGVLGAQEAVPEIVPFLKNESGQVRKMAVYVLGVLGRREVVSQILPLLRDERPDVRWNAALSLARLGDNAGRTVLTNVLDREYLLREYPAPEQEIETIMVNAAKGLALIGGVESLRMLEFLSENDKSLKVRQAALDAIRYLKGEKKDLEMEKVAA